MGKLAARRITLWLVALWPMFPGLFGCGGADSAGRRVTLFAAASAGGALDEVREEFKRETGIEVEASYAASSTLAQQIAYGARADVFVSANTDWADFLDRDSNVPVKQRRDLLGNRLVIIVPTGSQLSLQSPQDLLDTAVERLALADYTAVPAGVYAKQALTRLGLWEQLEGKVVSGADVRQALAYVETGAAEAGLVYATDAAASARVKIVAEIPAKLTGPIRYPIVLLEQGRSNPQAESFYRYLHSPEAARVFRKHGFTVHADAIAGG